ncbi:hypothetical protein M3Y94_00716900 [Aphelenchoides besseyi]|nr:hypothetical protein M3Y94_00716900 [Aphelenchoides besseyi]KAI6231766.1 hypothetical protein M3Y95_00416200 [Aphelenchoides besseyi]
MENGNKQNGSRRSDLTSAIEQKAAAEENTQSPSKSTSGDGQSIESNDVTQETTGRTTNRSTKRRRPHSNATELRFVMVHGRPDVARVQILLCNISDRPLFFKLKSNAGSRVSALPSGSGHIASRGSARLVLSWSRPSNVSKWSEVPEPKLLLITRFLNKENDISNDLTSTRLLAHVASKGFCPASQPPIEQLLLDAVSKPMDDGNLSAEMSISKAQAPEDIEQTQSSINDFINQLTPQQLAILIACLLVLFLALYNNVSRPSKGRHAY